MMPRRRVRALILLICLSALDFSGCFVRRRVITRKGSNPAPVLITADKQTLIDRLARQYDAIRSFNATVDMVPALGSSEKSKITEYKDVRGYILFRKPSDIRIIGLYPVVRNKAFDMVSNGKDFRLYLPSSNRFVIGSNQLIARSPNKIENLRPQHFLEALMVARGQILKQGEPLGSVGGTIDGPRLGFEIRHLTQPQDPNKWLKVHYK